MKVLVLGHSNSEGNMLPNPADGWPNLLRGLLREAGIRDAEVIHKRMYAGPSAPDMLRRQVEREQPDVVIVCTSTYGVVVRLISNQVRERWGERAGRMARKVEDYGARRRPRRKPSKTAVRAFLAARKVVRKAIGVLPTHSPEALAGYYEECFRTLAQFESVQGIVLTGVGYGHAVDKLNPGWEGPQNAVYSRLKPEALKHRFTWVPHEELLGGPVEKLPHFFSDGIHTDEESHRLAAAALLPIILEPVRTG